MTGPRATERFRPGDPVVWRSRPAGRLGHVLAATVMEDSDAVVALFQPAGAPVKRPTGRRGGPRGRNLLPGGWDGGHEDVVWRAPARARLHPVGRPYSVLRSWRPELGRYRGWYVNLEQPLRRVAIGFDSRDDVLDVVATDDLSSWRLKDADELDWSVEVGLYAADEARALRQTAAGVGAAIEARAWPFTEDAWTDLAPDPAWRLPPMPPEWNGDR